MKTLILVLSLAAPFTTAFAAGEGHIRLANVCENLHNIKTLPAGCIATCSVENGIPGQSSAKYTLTITKGEQSAHLVAEEVSQAQTIIQNDRMRIFASDRIQRVRLDMTVDRDNDVMRLQLNQIICE